MSIFLRKGAEREDSLHYDELPWRNGPGGEVSCLIFFFFFFLTWVCRAFEPPMEISFNLSLFSSYVLMSLHVRLGDLRWVLHVVVSSCGVEMSCNSHVYSRRPTRL